MRTVRYNTFETNSSSSHSLVITTENTHLTHHDMYEALRYCIHGGILTFDNDDIAFGRTPFDILSSFKEKLRYAYANYSRRTNNVTRVVKQLIPEIKGFELNKWSSDDWKGTDDNPLRGWLNWKGISLKEFLTNTKYKVVVDGDEYHVWERLKKNNLVNIGVIEEELRTSDGCPLYLPENEEYREYM